MGRRSSAAPHGIQTSHRARVRPTSMVKLTVQAPRVNPKQALLVFGMLDSFLYTPPTFLSISVRRPTNWKQRGDQGRTMRKKHAALHKRESGTEAQMELRWSSWTAISMRVSELRAAANLGDVREHVENCLDL